MTQEHILLLAAEELVPALSAIQRVVACFSEQAVDVVRCIAAAIGGETRDQAIGVITAMERITADAAGQIVNAVSAIQAVVPRLTIERVLIRAAFKPVVFIPAIDQIIAAKPAHDVIAGQRIDGVAICGPREIARSFSGPRTNLHEKTVRHEIACGKGDWRRAAQFDHEVRAVELIVGIKVSEQHRAPAIAHPPELRQDVAHAKIGQRHAGAIDRPDWKDAHEHKRPSVETAQTAAILKFDPITLAGVKVHDPVRRREEGVPALPCQYVGVRASGKNILPAAALQPIGSGATRQFVIPLAAIQLVVTVAAIETVLAPMAQKHILLFAAEELVPALSAVQRVIAGFSEQTVDVGRRIATAQSRETRDQAIGVITAMERITANAAYQIVGAVSAIQAVVSGLTIERVLIGAAVKPVVVIPAVDLIVTAKATHNVIAANGIDRVVPCRTGQIARSIGKRCPDLNEEASGHEIAFRQGNRRGAAQFDHEVRAIELVVGIEVSKQHRAATIPHPPELGQNVIETPVRQQHPLAIDRPGWKHAHENERPAIKASKSGAVIKLDPIPLSRIEIDHPIRGRKQRVPGSKSYYVSLPSSAEDILPPAALQPIGTGAPRQFIVALATVELVITRAAVEPIFARIAQEHILLLATEELILALSAVQRVIAPFPVQAVDVGRRVTTTESRQACNESVGIIASMERIFIGASNQIVAALPAFEVIVARFAMQRILIASAFQRVVALSAINLVVSAKAIHDVITCERVYDVSLIGAGEIIELQRIRPQTDDREIVDEISDGQCLGAACQRQIDEEILFTELTIVIGVDPDLIARLAGIEPPHYVNKAVAHKFCRKLRAGRTDGRKLKIDRRDVEGERQTGTECRQVQQIPSGTPTSLEIDNDIGKIGRAVASRLTKAKAKNICSAAARQCIAAQAPDDDVGAQPT
nr:hypothetical protein [Sphingobium lactosutens]